MGIHWGLGNKKKIVHVIGPENGITLPGATIVCGDSTLPPTAFGAICRWYFGGRNGPFYTMYHAKNLKNAYSRRW
jgi:hypothetical protein